MEIWVKIINRPTQKFNALKTILKILEWEKTGEHLI